jgi:hypothetical protein
LSGNDAEHNGDAASLLEKITTKPTEPCHAVSHIQFRIVFELLLLAVGHHSEGDTQSVFGSEALCFYKGYEFTVNADVWIIAHFEMKV